MNILWIVIDALRYDVFKTIINGEYIMPNVSKLSRSCISFENAYSTTNTTDPSLTAMFSSLYPTSSGLLHHGQWVTSSEIKKLKHIIFLPEILKSNGYRTIAIDFLGRWHRRGYDYYVNPRDNFRSILLIKKIIKKFKLSKLARKIVVKHRKKYITPYKAEEAVNSALRYLIKKNKVFIFIHFWDTHIPYYSPNKYISCDVFESFSEVKLKDIKKDIPGPWIDKLMDIYNQNYLISDIICRYYNAARYVDIQIGKLLSSVDLDKYLIIITSDHGESLGEHNIWFDHHGLYQPSIRVPLIMCIPNVKPKIIRNLFQHVDILPTLSSILGININRKLIDGLDFSDIILSNKAYDLRKIIYISEWHTQNKLGLIYNNYKLIISQDQEDGKCRYCGISHGGNTELYDLRNDALELNNIAELEKETRQLLYSYLMRIVKKSARKRMSLRVKIRKRD